MIKRKPKEAKNMIQCFEGKLLHVELFCIAAATKENVLYNR